MHHSHPPIPPPPVSPSPRHREPTSSWLTWHFLHFSSSSPRHLAHRFLLQSSPPRCSSTEWPAKESQARSCRIRDPWEQGQDPGREASARVHAHSPTRCRCLCSSRSWYTVCPQRRGFKATLVFALGAHTPFGPLRGQSKRGGQQAQGHLRPTQSACKTPAGLPVL